jgi:hypothetical protein
MDKLKVKDLKLIIKKYKKEKPISGMKKEDLKEHVEHLKINGKLICVGNCKRGNCSCTLEGSGVLDLFKSQKLELSNTAKGIIAKSGNLIIRKLKLFKKKSREFRMHPQTLQPWGHLPNSQIKLVLSYFILDV